MQFFFDHKLLKNLLVYTFISNNHSANICMKKKKQQHTSYRLVQPVSRMV